MGRERNGREIRHKQTQRQRMLEGRQACRSQFRPTLTRGVSGHQVRARHARHERQVSWARPDNERALWFDLALSATGTYTDHVSRRFRVFLTILCMASDPFSPLLSPLLCSLLFPPMASATFAPCVLHLSRSFAAYVLWPFLCLFHAPGISSGPLLVRLAVAVTNSGRRLPEAARWSRAGRQT